LRPRNGRELEIHGRFTTITDVLLAAGPVSKNMLQFGQVEQH
jgi:hypothetical protein